MRILIAFNLLCIVCMYVACAGYTGHTSDTTLMKGEYPVADIHGFAWDYEACLNIVKCLNATETYEAFACRMVR